MSGVAADHLSVRSPGGRLVLVVSAAILIASAVWFGVSWIDAPPDQTCESVVHATYWLGSAPSGCHNVMTLRAVVTGCLLVLAIALLAKAGSRQSISRAWIAAAVIGLVGSGVLLVINEGVRSMGAL